MMLSNKVALITGAGSGIGAASARMFAREGAKVVVAEIDEATGRACASRIVAEGGTVSFVRCDVTDEGSVAQAVSFAVSEFGALHVLYNNVGGSTLRDGLVTEVALDEFWRAIRVDLFGTFLCCRHGIPAIIESGGGSVINATSMVARVGVPGKDCYTAAKGGVTALTRSMAVEFASRNVRVNAIAPGMVATERVRDFLRTGQDHPAFSDATVHRRSEKDSHLLGILEPDDIAALATFLASERSARITGTIMAADSGATSW